MAVDVIARALAAKASSGGSGNKVPIDITGAMDEVLSAINISIVHRGTNSSRWKRQCRLIF